MSNGIGRVWAVNAEGGDEGRPNGVGPVYIENIDKIGGGVPDPSGASTGDVLTVDDQGNPAWEPPSATVSTDGVISGDGSAADPVVLNVGTGLSTVTSGGTTTFTVTDIVSGCFRLTRDQALAIFQSQSPVTVNFTGNGSWKVNSAGSEYIFVLGYNFSSTAEGKVFFNPLRQWNDATYPQPYEGDISAVNYILDPSNVDTTHGISIQSMVSALEADPTIEYVYLTYCVPQYGYWTSYPEQLSGYSATFTVPSASVATTSLVVANPVPDTTGASQGDVLTIGSTGPEWAAAGANYSAGAGISISEQGAISAVGGEGITVTAGSTVQKTLSAHTQDYEAPWQAGLIVHMVTYMSLLDSSLVADIQNGGIDVTLTHPFEQYALYNEGGGGENSYLFDWESHRSYFKAYAAIVELETITYSSGPTYWGSTTNRLVLGEITSQWADPSGNYPTILANTVVNYDFADVNSSLSTITLADVLANPGNYCLTVMFYDTYGNLNAFDDGAEHTTCTMISSYVTGEGTYTTGSYTAMSPSAITVTNPLPASAASDSGKVLTVDAQGAPAWATPSVTVDQTYNAYSTNAQSGTAVAGALSTTRQVPPCYTSDANKVLTVNSLGIAGWATPSGVTKQVISLTGATTSGDTTTTFTFNLASANQFYALGKQVSVSYKPPYLPMADVSGSKIKLYYGTSTITLDATTYANIFCASVFVGNETNISQASDPSLGYKFTKVEIVVPISGSDWTNSTEAESLQIQILG
jgi:hypothetical protein